MGLCKTTSLRWLASWLETIERPHTRPRGGMADTACLKLAARKSIVGSNPTGVTTSTTSHKGEFTPMKLYPRAEFLKFKAKPRRFFKRIQWHYSTKRCTAQCAGSFNLTVQELSKTCFEWRCGGFYESRIQNKHGVEKTRFLAQKRATEAYRNLFDPSGIFQ